MEGVCIGVDVGGTNLRFALVDKSGAVLCRESEPTEKVVASAPFVARLQGALRRLQGEAVAGGVRVAGVGIGVPGLVSAEGVVLSSVNLPALKGVDLGSELARALGVPVLVLNDANACALGEQRFGAGRRYRSWLMLTIGTGVGAGLILDGRLWTGANGLAGELGHLTVEPDGRPCGCGNRGCLEQYTFATAISSGNDSAAAVARRAASGDAAAVARFEEAGRYLGIAAAGVLNLLNLEAVILGGGVSESFELLAPAMRREIRSRTLALPGAAACVVKGALGPDAGVLGAAQAAFDAEKNSSRSHLS
ncbi:ROK family protein [Citrifermentans bremense]|uniref:ROK family protein n=1 Tax=Citrifermentans bremense TaxID=60035 RepID=A0A6S6M961_9BACT|nr:ROK family protein [Citrifermentans bremense]BCG48051.1 ROK family protein [Citrifermentans bremense]